MAKSIRHTEFGKWLETRKRFYKLNYVQLAEYFQMDYNNLIDLTNGLYKPTTKEIDMIASCFNLTKDEKIELQNIIAIDYNIIQENRYSRSPLGLLYYVVDKTIEDINIKKELIEFLKQFKINLNIIIEDDDEE